MKVEIRERDKYVVRSWFYSSSVYLKVRFITCTILLCRCITSSPSQLPEHPSKVCPDRWPKPASNKITFCSILCKVLESFWKCSSPSPGSRALLGCPALPTARHPTSRRLPIPPSAAGASFPSGRAAQGQQRGARAGREEAAAHTHTPGAERGTPTRHSIAPPIGYPGPIIRWLLAFVLTLKATASSISPLFHFAFKMNSWLLGVQVFACV